MDDFILSYTAINENGRVKRKVTITTNKSYDIIIMVFHSTTDDAEIFIKDQLHETTEVLKKINTKSDFRPWQLKSSEL